MDNVPRFNENERRKYVQIQAMATLFSAACSFLMAYLQ